MTVAGGPADSTCLKCARSAAQACEIQECVSATGVVRARSTVCGAGRAGAESAALDLAKPGKPGSPHTFIARPCSVLRRRLIDGVLKPFRVSPACRASPISARRFQRLRGRPRACHAAPTCSRRSHDAHGRSRNTADGDHSWLRSHVAGGFLGSRTTPAADVAPCRLRSHVLGVRTTSATLTQ